MFIEIQSALRLDKHSIENKRINIVQEPSTDASFLLHHFVSLAVKSNCNILIISLEQTFGHFYGIGMKLGYDLLKLQKKGQVIFYDALKTAHGSYLNNTECTDNDADIFEFHSGKTTLSSFITVIKEKIDGFSDKTRPVFVIIDKLSLFLSLGVKLPSVVNLILRVQSLVQEKNGSLGNIQKQAMRQC